MLYMFEREVQFSLNQSNGYHQRKAMFYWQMDEKVKGRLGDGDTQGEGRGLKAQGAVPELYKSE